MAKLKTLEYRLFRKMREKLRNYFAQERKVGDEPKPIGVVVTRFR